MWKNETPSLFADVEEQKKDDELPDPTFLRVDPLLGLPWSVRLTPEEIQAYSENAAAGQPIRYRCEGRR